MHCITFGSPRFSVPDFIKLYDNNIDVSYRCVRFKVPVQFTPLPLRLRLGIVELNSHSIVF